MCPSRRGVRQAKLKPHSCGPRVRPSDARLRRDFPQRRFSAVHPARIRLAFERMLAVFAPHVPVRHTRAWTVLPLHLSNPLNTKASRPWRGWRADWTISHSMVAYNRTRQSSDQEPGPRCPKCDSTRTEVIGMSTSHNATFLRCGGCGARSERRCAIWWRRSIRAGPILKVHQHVHVKTHRPVRRARRSQRRLDARQPSVTRCPTSRIRHPSACVRWATERIEIQVETATGRRWRKAVRAATRPVDQWVTMEGVHEMFDGAGGRGRRRISTRSHRTTGRLARGGATAEQSLRGGGFGTARSLMRGWRDFQRFAVEWQGAHQRVNSSAAWSLPVNPRSHEQFPESCDVAVVGAGAAGLATAIFARRVESRALGRAARRRAQARREDPRQRRRRAATSPTPSSPSAISGADARRSSAACCARSRSPTPSRSSASSASRLHEEAGGKLFPDTNRARDVLDALLRESDARRRALLAGHRVLDVERSADGFRVDHRSRASCARRRVVLATGGQSLPKSGQRRRRLRDRAAPGPHDRADHAGARAAGARRRTIASTASCPACRRTSSSPSGSTARSPSRLTGALLWTHFGDQRSGRAQRVAPLAARAARGTSGVDHRQLLPGRTFEEVDASWWRRAARPARAPRCRRRSRRSCRRRSPRRSCGDSASTARRAGASRARRSPAAVARAGRMAAAGRRHARLQLRRSDGRRRRARRRSIRRRWQSRVCPGLYCVGEIARRGRPDRRIQLPVGLVERLRRRTGAGRSALERVREPSKTQWPVRVSHYSAGAAPGTRSSEWSCRRASTMIIAMKPTAESDSKPPV